MENSYWDKVDLLFDLPDVFYVDFLPHAIEGDEFSWLDDYFTPAFQKKFPQAITNIILKSFYYKTALISSSALSDEAWHTIGELRPNRFEEVLKAVLSSDNYNLHVYYPDDNVLIYFPGEETVQIYGLKSDFYDLLNLLVQSEGLFLVKQSNYYPPGYIPKVFSD